MKYLQTPSLFLFFLLMIKISFSQEPLRVLDAYRGGESVWVKYQGINQSWYDHLNEMADEYLIQRAKDVTACSTQEAWEKRKTIIQQNLLQSIGGLPKKTPLNAKVVEKLERENFIVEKLIYESLPGFYVTAALFLPKERPNPLPAVIYCSGHTEDGFRSSTYQNVIINLVKKGFVVLAFDPIGQGERYQNLDKNGQPQLGPTRDHSYSGIQAMLVGKTLASYMIHDGIRAVDYLISRPEVDPHRIGITGRSGGGTQSAYIAAFDERILAVAPENYITNFRRIWASIGPQDAEQNFMSAHKLGIDHGDLLAVRAPKPTMILTTYRDFFSIQGARETYEEVEDIYSLYDKKGNLHFTEDDGGHGSTKANREKCYAFFQEYLNLPGDAKDVEVEVFSAEELQITQTGQVGTALESKTIFDLVNESFDDSPNPSKEEIVQFIKENLSSISEIEKPKAVYTGRVVTENYIAEKYFLEFASKRYPIPFLSIKSPSQTSKGIVLYLNSRGKEVELKSDGEIIQLLQKGYEVIAVDVLNQGELASNPFRGDSHIEGVSYNLVLGSSLVGTSLPMLQTQDLVILMDHLSQKFPTHKMIGIADNNLCIPLLHLATISDNFEHIILKQPLISWKNFLQTRTYAPSLAYSVIPNVLSHYDLPDLLRLVSASKLTIVSPMHADGSKVRRETWEETYGKGSKRFSVIEKLNLEDLWE